MDFTLDLDAYFERIEDSGPRAPTLATLNRVIAAHASRIPFENLDILRGLPISLRPEDIEAKLVRAGRGGYCFEQNTLMLHVLRALGFEVQPLSARVRIKQPREFIPPRTHLVLRVRLDGESWLVDVGVGALTPTAALRLSVEGEQETPHETRRIVAKGSWSGFDLRAPDARLFHQALLGDTWQDVYELTLEEMHPIDRELGNWYTSAHPDSHFRNRLVVALAREQGRVTLLNWELKRRAADGRATSRTLKSPEELLEALREEFGLRFEPGTQFVCPGLE